MIESQDQLILPEPDLYAHELIRNGGGIWLGCAEKNICEQAHVPGETGEEIRKYYEESTVRSLIAKYRDSK